MESRLRDNERESSSSSSNSVMNLVKYPTIFENFHHGYPALKSST